MIILLLILLICVAGGLVFTLLKIPWDIWGMMKEAKIERLKEEADKQYAINHLIYIGKGYKRG